MDLAIDATGLRKRFGRTDVLDGLDLTVAAGTVFALLGPERRRQDDHHQHPHDARATRPGQRPGRGLRRRRRRRRRQAAHRPHRAVRGRRRGAHGHREPRHAGPALRAVAPRRDGASRRARRALRPVGCREPTCRHLLGRHAPAARPRPQPRRRRAGDLPRRADDRPRHPQPSSSSGRSSGRWPMPARRSSSRRSTSRRPTGWPIASPCSTAVASPPRAPPTSSRRVSAATSSSCAATTASSCASCPPTASVHGLRAAMDELDRTPAAAAEGVQVTIRRPSLDDVFLAITAGGGASARSDRDLIESK